MSKKDFIALADYMRQEHPYNSTEEDQVAALADWCKRRYPNFNRERWVAYVAGTVGPNGGAR